MSLGNLKSEIKAALKQSGPDHAVLESMSNQLGDAINKYIQEQVGLRLRGLPVSLNCTAPGAPVAPGAQFPTLTRVE